GIRRQQPIRPGHRHGRGPGRRHAAVRHARIRRQPPDRRREGGCRAMTTIELTRPTTTVTPNKQPLSAGDRAVLTSTHALLALWTVIIVIPLLWILMSSFKSTSEVLSDPLALPSTLHWENYVNAWQKAGIGTWFLNTII